MAVEAGIGNRRTGPFTGRAGLLDGEEPLLHPNLAGQVVYFGTGKYYETTDGDPANAVQYNTMYGIWDRDLGSTITSVTTRNSNVLQQQTITTQTAGTFGSNSYDIRLVSDNAMNWVTKSGNSSKVWPLRLLSLLKTLGFSRTPSGPTTTPSELWPAPSRYLPPPVSPS